MTQIDWQKITKTIQNESWAKVLYKDTKKDLDWFIENYQDDAQRIAGWFHHYNCEKCDGRLIFDIKDRHHHVCSACGHINQSETLEKVWNNMYRGHANSSVYHCAVVYQMEKDPKYIEHIKRVLDFYADHYDEFTCEPPAKRFEGKILNQHLDDAVGMMTILLGMDMVYESFTEVELSKWYEKLFQREAAMFDFFASRIYNIPVWIKCAQAMIGVFFNEPEHIDKGIRSQFGLLDQLERGVTEEGMWYEGSMHYHFYTIQPISYLLYMMKRKEFEIPESTYIYNRVEKMFEYPLKMMFQNRKLPNPNDAHPIITLDMYHSHYEYASVIFENPLFKDVCGSFYEKESHEGGFTRLLFNHYTNTKKLPDFGTVNNPLACTAMLRDKTTEVFFKYGILTHLHRHPDVMNFEMSFDGDVVSYDIGNGGYGSKLFVEWQRKTIAHNTVAIDQQDQNRMGIPQAAVTGFDIQNNCIRTKAKGVYQAVDYERMLQVQENDVMDEFTIHGWGEYTIDWFFYCKGQLHVNQPTQKIESLGDEEGYQHLFDIEMFETNEDWKAAFDMDDKRIEVTMEGEKGTQVYLINSYTASKQVKRRGLMVRRKTDKTTYKTRYRCLKK